MSTSAQNNIFDTKDGDRSFLPSMALSCRENMWGVLTGTVNQLLTPQKDLIKDIAQKRLCDRCYVSQTSYETLLSMTIDGMHRVLAPWYQMLPPVYYIVGDTGKVVPAGSMRAMIPLEAFKSTIVAYVHDTMLPALQQTNGAIGGQYVQWTATGSSISPFILYFAMSEGVLHLKGVVFNVREERTLTAVEIEHARKMFQYIGEGLIAGTPTTFTVGNVTTVERANNSCKDEKFEEIPSSMQETIRLVHTCGIQNLITMIGMVMGMYKHSQEAENAMESSRKKTFGNDNDNSAEALLRFVNELSLLLSSMPTESSSTCCYIKSPLAKNRDTIIPVKSGDMWNPESVNVQVAMRQLIALYEKYNTVSIKKIPLADLAMIVQLHQNLGDDFSLPPEKTATAKAHVEGIADSVHKVMGGKNSSLPSVRVK